MTRFFSTRLTLVFVILAVAIMQTQTANAQPVVKLRGAGTLVFSDAGPAEFVLGGNASHLGKYTCFGEVDFIAGEEEGSLIGTGVAVFEAANGDLLVGVVFWELDATGIGTVSFPWRDSVTFSNGATFESTGRFRSGRPAGARATTIVVGDELRTQSEVINH
jgi:hypothetical protein